MGSRTLTIARHYPPQAEPVFHITIDTQPFLITKFFIKNGDDSIIILLLGLINPFSSINSTFSVKRGIEGKSILAVFPPLWNDLYGYMKIHL